MIHKGTYLLIVALLGFQFAFSQAAPIERENTVPMQNLEFSMQRQQLTSPQLYSFGQRALQKMKDVLGYLQLMEDSSLDEGFRERAERLALQAFISPAAFQEFMQKVPARQQVQGLELHTPFALGAQQEQGPYYEGKIKLLFANHVPASVISAYLIRQEKQFGKETSFVWEVKLGSK